MSQLTISNITKEDNLVTELNLLELQQIKGGGGKAGGKVVCDKNGCRVEGYVEINW